MKLYLVISVLMLSLVMVAVRCKHKEKPAPELTKHTADLYQEGLSVVIKNCSACHSLQPDVDKRIAPTMAAIKSQYLNGDVSEATFVQRMSQFLLTPSIIKAQMPDAVKQYGLMPNVGLSEQQYIAAATYIFRADLQKPGWFENDFQNEKNNLASSDSKDYLSKGMDIAMATKAVLGKNLLGAIKESGTEGALRFCNKHAIPLTDSMALHLGANIRRVSDRNRNSQNIANERERNYIHAANVQLAKGEKPTAQVFDNGGHMIGYYPIITNEMCLSCHGKATEINAETQAAIREAYPQDNATGYDINELRGIWVIEMKK